MANRMQGYGLDDLVPEELSELIAQLTQAVERVRITVQLRHLKPLSSRETPQSSTSGSKSSAVNGTDSVAHEISEAQRSSEPRRRSRSSSGSRRPQERASLNGEAPPQAPVTPGRGSDSPGPKRPFHSPPPQPVDLTAKASDSLRRGVQGSGKLGLSQGALHGVAMMKRALSGHLSRGGAQRLVSSDKMDGPEETGSVADSMY